MKVRRAAWSFLLLLAIVGEHLLAEVTVESSAVPLMDNGSISPVNTSDSPSWTTGLDTTEQFSTTVPNVMTVDTRATESTLNLGTTEDAMATDPSTTTLIPAERVEKFLKQTINSVFKKMLPNFVRSSNVPNVSSKCLSGLLKYVTDLRKVKVWAIKMLDSTSKIPAGIFEGTTAEFGSFDQCLEIVVPTRNISEEVRGQYCSVQAKPKLPPAPKNLSLAIEVHAKPDDTVNEMDEVKCSRCYEEIVLLADSKKYIEISKELIAAGHGFYFLEFRLGVCVPSTCTEQDMNALATEVTKGLQIDVKIPRCYVKENVKILPIHTGVICTLAILLILAIAGAAAEKRCQNSAKFQSLFSILKAFSLSSNSRKLLTTKVSSTDMSSLHGIRVLSMLWVVLGHTFVWVNLNLTRRIVNLQRAFSDIEFEAILNGWLSVEGFFFLSGLLTTYATLQVMAKTKGRLNIMVFIIRRYIRLTPPMLLVMGLIYFLPVISSGPFWYEQIDTNINACSNYWWTNLIYINNWSPLSQICVHPTWYLSADFQLHVLSLVILIPLYRKPLLGLALISIVIVGCNAVIGILTYTRDLHPTILVSSGNRQHISEVNDIIHIRTFTHAAPYCIGMVVGYIIIKKKDVKLNKLIQIAGWSLAAILSISSLYGTHRWNSGHFHSTLVASIYAALHRTSFIIGLSWVAFVCITKNGGPVNAILSLPVLVPLSRLSFMCYLVHSLVIWTRVGSQRERMYFSNYNLLYEYISNVVLSLALSLFFHLLVEAPTANLERLLFFRQRPPKDEAPETNRNAAPPLRVNGVQLTAVHAASNGGFVPESDTK